MNGFGGKSKRKELQSSSIHCDSNNRMTAFVDEELASHIWFPFWSFEQRGLKLELGTSIQSTVSFGDVPHGAIVNGNVFHWLKVPGEFSTYFMTGPKDKDFTEAYKSGEVKTYEVKGGKIIEVSSK
jgi:hypothetical protein